jgi:phosphatidylglycerophosphate synthase
MIDALFKDRMDLFWNRFGRRVARTGLTANHVTVIGLLLCTLNVLVFLWHRNLAVFGIALGLIELLDNLDGAVARVTGQSTRFGSYLDATTDRYKELFIFLALGHVTGYWVVCILATTGSLMVSYSHARAAMELTGLEATGEDAKPGVGGASQERCEAGEAEDRGWPDLFERFERILTLSVGLAVSPLVPSPLFLGRDLVFLVLLALAVMTHLTVVQRFRRARTLLAAADASAARPRSNLEGSG